MTWIHGENNNGSFWIGLWDSFLAWPFSIFWRGWRLIVYIVGEIKLNGFN